MLDCLFVSIHPPMVFYNLDKGLYYHLVTSIHLKCTINTFPKFNQSQQSYLTAAGQKEFDTDSQRHNMSFLHELFELLFVSFLISLQFPKISALSRFPNAFSTATPLVSVLRVRAGPPSGQPLTLFLASQLDLFHCFFYPFSELAFLERGRGLGKWVIDN